MRKKIQMTDSPRDLVVAMAEGNPGAIRVLLDLLTSDPVGGWMDLLHLDDMNMWGTQVWIAYKDHCGGHLETFRTAVRSRDAAMIETVNAMGRRGNHAETAVQSGASQHRPAPLSKDASKAEEDHAQSAT